MAFIVKRKRSDGSVGYQVRWRQDGKWQSDIFDTERKVARFVLDGDRWPAGWVPGVGHVKDVGPTSTATPFLHFAEQYLNTRTATCSGSSPRDGPRSRHPTVRGAAAASGVAV